MKKFTLPTMGFLATAVAVAGIATDALARRGVGGAGSVGSFSAENFQSVSPVPIAPNSPIGREVEGLNFNNQLRNGATGSQLPGLSSQPKHGTINRQSDTNSNSQPGNDSIP